MANNVQYILVGVRESGALQDTLGRQWIEDQEDRLQQAQDNYFAETWQPVVSLLTQLQSDARTDVRPYPLQHCDPLLPMRCRTSNCTFCKHVYTV